MYSRIYDTNVPYVHCSTETFATLQCVLAVALLPVSINPRPPPVSTSSCNSECFFQYVFIKCCVSPALLGGGSVKVRVKLAHISNADWSRSPKLKCMCELRLLVKTLTRVSSLRCLFIVPRIVKFC